MLQRAFRQYTCRSHLCLFKVQSCYKFCTSNWNKGDILEKLNKEIIEYSNHIQKNPHFVGEQSYFSDLSWNVTYNHHLNSYTYAKVLAQHQVKVIVDVKPNLPFINSFFTLFGNERKLSYQADFSWANIFIRKKQSNKWLVCQTAVIDKELNMFAVFFSKKEPSKQVHHTYFGPELSTLQSKVIQCIKKLLQEVGLSELVILNMITYSSGKVEETNLAWLKNIKEILD